MDLRLRWCIAIQLKIRKRGNQWLILSRLLRSAFGGVSFATGEGGATLLGLCAYGNLAPLSDEI